jgi:hypothetical protein
MECSRLKNLIHVGKISNPHEEMLFLRKIDELTYRWFAFLPTFHEEKTLCEGITIVEAIKKARRFWQEDFFRLFHCGFRYYLPARDFVGTNALFFQMVASYSSANGHYFDEEVGHFCYVDFASQEALDLMRKLKELNV